MLERFEQFCFVISGIYQYIQKIERDEMIQYGCKGSFAQYLVVLNRSAEGLTSAQLCELCDKDKAAVSRVVAEMEEKGLVARQSPKDILYRARIQLTAEGKKAAQYVCERAKAVVLAAGKGLTDENRQIFYATLDLIASNLQIISKEGTPKQ